MWILLHLPLKFTQPKEIINFHTPIATPWHISEFSVSTLIKQTVGTTMFHHSSNNDNQSKTYHQQHENAVPLVMRAHNLWNEAVSMGRYDPTGTRKEVRDFRNSL